MTNLPSDPQGTMTWLMQRGPEEWSAYLHRVENGEPSPISLLVICDCAITLAKDKMSLEFAEVAVKASDLEARQLDDVGREDMTWRTMEFLRCWFICKMDPLPGHPILNIQLVLDWILSGLTLPIEDVRAKCTSIRSAAELVRSSHDPQDKARLLNDLHLLLRIKHRLRCARILAACGKLSDNPVLQQWLEIQNLLP
jgi:hypothetical protein